MGMSLRVVAAVVSAALAAGLAVQPAPAGAQGRSPDELSRRQAEAQRQQEALRERIQSLQGQIESRESDRQEAADALRQSERAISDLNRRLAELEDDVARVVAELGELEAGIKRQSRELDERREALATQLRAQYASGLSPWTALLSGDDPQELGRNLSYLDYLSKARADDVAALRREIERLESLRESERQRRAELQALQEETGQRRTELVAQQKERATVLARLEGQLKAQRSEAGRLDRDDQRLGDLVAELGQQVVAAREEEARIRAEEERRRQEEAEARRQEDARRQAEAARQAQEAQRQAEQQAAEQRAAAQRQADEPAPDRPPAREGGLVAHSGVGLTPIEPRRAEQAPPPPSPPPQPRPQPAPPPPAEPARTPSAPASPPSRGALEEASGLRPGLPMPVQGSVMARFGTARPDGGNWRGILLRAPEGTPVKAVAAGTVVYAEWLRGFGNLVIVDHGQQYMSVYAHNQGLLKKVGDVVRAGDTVATVGATGGQVESGLYFEIRHRGAPQDPGRFFAAR